MNWPGMLSRIFISHIIMRTIVASAMYSASAELSVTDGCSLLPKQIRSPAPRFYRVALHFSKYSGGPKVNEAVVHNPDMDWKELKMPHILLRPCSESVWHLHWELYLRCLH